jgi:hypothetical protein
VKFTDTAARAIRKPKAGDATEPEQTLLGTHQLELSQEQLEALASGVVLCFDQGGAILRVTADAKAVAAFKQHVHLALLAHLNPSNPSIQ